MTPRRRRRGRATRGRPSAPPRLLSLPAEDLAAGPPTSPFFERLLSEIAAPATRWTIPLVERLDYAYSDILLRATAAGDTVALRRLGEHVGRVLAIRRDDLAVRGSPYFDRWQFLVELAERRVLKQEAALGLLDSPWIGDVLRQLERGAVPSPRLAAALGLTESRLARVLSDLERWELIACTRAPGDARRSRSNPPTRLTPLGQELARESVERGDATRPSPCPDRIPRLGGRRRRVTSCATRRRTRPGPPA